MSGPAIPPSYGARQAQPLDTMLEQAAGGWSFFDPQDAKEKRGTWHEAIEERAAQAALDAAAVMETKAGRALVEYLADISVRRPTFVLGMPDPLTYAAFREGQNGLFFALLRLIATGRQESAAVREGT
jgi:hypothetical protein